MQGVKARIICGLRVHAFGHQLFQERKAVRIATSHVKGRLADSIIHIDIRACVNEGERSAGVRILAGQDERL